MATATVPLNLYDNDRQRVVRRVREDLLKVLDLKNVDPYEIDLFRRGYEANFNGQSVWITSVASQMHNITPGATCDATPRVAASRIAEGTHRLATKEEIEKFHSDQRQREEQCRVKEIEFALRDGKIRPGQAQSMIAEGGLNKGKGN